MIAILIQSPKTTMRTIDDLTYLAQCRRAMRLYYLPNSDPNWDLETVATIGDWRWLTLAAVNGVGGCDWTTIDTRSGQRELHTSVEAHYPSHVR